MSMPRHTLFGFATVVIASLAIGWTAPAAHADGWSHRHHSSCSSRRYRPVYRHDYSHRSYHRQRCRPAYRPYYSRSHARWNRYNASHYRYRGCNYYGSHRLSRLYR